MLQAPQLELPHSFTALHQRSNISAPTLVWNHHRWKATRRCTLGVGRGRGSGVGLRESPSQSDLIQER